ncbi:hypothetical protein LUZ61_000923 [Rhynchospora tenuis]|uniref:Uncharacterized protein n=1 Tax=Rhynchospora tenuis TaxID=198213 RepID=A0AAD5ZG26_9POAL|nr:hypothetical protein LUZ61_000923 [Rhynchospora tenuis]
MSTVHLFSVAFAFFAIATVVAAERPTFTVEGRVYCDTCRAGFETSATTYISGAKVRLECRHFSDGKIEHQVDGVTSENGTYAIELKDNHEKEICEIVLVQSPLSTCAEIPKGRDRASVLLADGGLSSNVRYANALGFLKYTPLSVCADVLKKYNEVA